MKKLLIFLSILVLVLFTLFPIDEVEARRGCCSWHGGVCSVRCCDGSIGYICCDGTPLSSKCAPYYPQCGVCQQPTSEEEKSPPPSEDVITYSYDYSKPILREGSRGYWVVELQKGDRDIDEYNRYLRYVYVDGVFVNAELIAEGFAESFIFDALDKYSQVLVRLEQYAKLKKVGIWK